MKSLLITAVMLAANALLPVFTQDYKDIGDYAVPFISTTTIIGYTSSTNTYIVELTDDKCVHDIIYSAWTRAMNRYRSLELQSRFSACRKCGSIWIHQIEQTPVYSSKMQDPFSVIISSFHVKKSTTAITAIE